jgi:murein DD-endopeptidase MepM/ murein hydrolase activator NlpD
MAEIPIPRNKLLESFIVSMQMKPMEASEHRRAKEGLDSLSESFRKLKDQAGQTADNIKNKVKTASQSLSQMYYDAQILGTSARKIDAFAGAAARLGSSRQEATRALFEFHQQLQLMPGTIDGIAQALARFDIKVEPGGDIVDKTIEVYRKVGELAKRGQAGEQIAANLRKAFGLDEHLAWVLSRPEWKEAINDQLARNKALEQGAVAAAKLSEAITNFNEAFKALKDELSVKLMEDFGPSIRRLADWLKAHRQDIVDFIHKVVEQMKQAYHDLYIDKIAAVFGAVFSSLGAEIFYIVTQTDALRYALDGLGMVFYASVFFKFIVMMQAFVDSSFIAWVLRIAGVFGLPAAAAIGAFLASTKPAGEGEDELYRQAHPDWKPGEPKDPKWIPPAPTTAKPPDVTTPDVTTPGKPGKPKMPPEKVVPPDAQTTPESAPPPAETPSGGLVSPVTGTIEGRPGMFFGAPRGGGRRRHSGIDWAAPDGSPVVAPIGGTILHAGLHTGYRNMVDLLGDDGNIYRMAFHGEPKVRAGRVEQGQVVGTIALRHLHMEMIPKGTAKNEEMRHARGGFVTTSHQRGTVDYEKLWGMHPGQPVVAGKPLPIRGQQPVAHEADRPKASVPPVKNPWRDMPSGMVFDPEFHTSALRSTSHLAFTGNRNQRATIHVATSDPHLAAREVARHMKRLSEGIMAA